MLAKLVPQMLLKFLGRLIFKAIDNFIEILRCDSVVHGPVERCGDQAYIDILPEIAGVLPFADHPFDQLHIPHFQAADVFGDNRRPLRRQLLAHHNVMKALVAHQAIDHAVDKNIEFLKRGKFTGHHQCFEPGARFRHA